MLTNLFAGCGVHERRVFNALQKAGPMSKSQLLEATGYKLTSLNRFLRPLETKKLVVQLQFGESSGGRKPMLYDVTNRGHYLLGLDISRIYMQVVLTNLKMQPIAARRFEMDIQSTPEWTIHTAAQTARQFLKQECGESEGQIVLAGIGAVGPMQRSDGVLLSPRFFRAAGWQQVPVVSMLREKLGCPVSLDNGANTAALAESLYGIGRGVSRVVYVNCGVGIRTGTFFDGMIIRTPQNEEDVFGHMVVDADGKRCICGKQGCLDCYASARAITADFSVRRQAGESSTLPHGAAWEQICVAADEGDALASDVLRHAGRYLGVGLSNLVNLLAPGLVILSGPLIRQSRLYYDTAANTAKHLLWTTQSGVAFHRGGRMQEDAIAVGGAALALEEALDVPVENRNHAPTDG